MCEPKCADDTLLGACSSPSQEGAPPTHDGSASPIHALQRFGVEQLTRGSGSAPRFAAGSPSRPPVVDFTSPASWGHLGARHLRGQHPGHDRL